MKKVLLTAAAALAVFAAVPVFANGNHTLSNNDADKPFDINAAIKEEDKADAEDAVAKTMKANKLKEGENLKVDRGEAAPAAKAPAAKMLPKTSAVK